MQGVVWSGNHVIPHAPETISLLRKMGKRIFFLTNGAIKSRSQYVELFRQKGFTVHKVRDDGEYLIYSIG
jgi:ribonucleotide monophosphatase NagD (HAD superfamily)